MKTENHPPMHPEELDLAIPDMDSETAVAAVQASLRQLPGIVRARLVQRGAFVRYNPLGTSKDQISAAIRQAGYRPGTFQDSKSGHLGRSSQ